VLCTCHGLPMFQNGYWPDGRKSWRCREKKRRAALKYTRRLAQERDRARIDKLLKELHAKA
jgi:hypothetical protein